MSAPARGARSLQVGFLIAGVAAAGFALWAAVSQSDDAALPSPVRWVIALALAVGSLLASGRAWLAILESTDRQVAGALYISQLAKYLPGGGILQAAGAVGLSRNEDVGTAQAVLAVPVSALLTLASCAVLGVGNVFYRDVPTWVRLLSLTGLLGPIVLYRPILTRTIELLRRVSRRIPSAGSISPQPAIVRGAVWTAVSVTCSCLAFATLAQPLVGASVPRLVSAFAIAWAVGYLALPIPGGLGVREASLIALIGGSAVPLVAGSLVQRIVTIVAELAIVAVHVGLGIREGQRDSSAG